MSKRFSVAFERDYSFYLDNKDRFTFAGTDIKSGFNIQYPGEPELIDKDDDGNDIVIPFATPYSPSGKDAKKCFHLLDGAGKRAPCSEPELLVQILTCKAAVNLQIKIWAEGRAEYSTSKKELQEYTADYPEWVFKAVEIQKQKILNEWIADKRWKDNSFYRQALTYHLGEFLEEIAVANDGRVVILDRK